MPSGPVMLENHEKQGSFRMFVARRKKPPAEIAAICTKGRLSGAGDRKLIWRSCTPRSRSFCRIFDNSIAVKKQA